MRILSRYIGKTVIASTLAVMMVFLILYAFTALLNEIREVGKGSYTLWDAVVITGLQIPRQLYDLFPLTALMGTMLGLGALASNSELTVMRASGVSIRQIIVSVLKAGGLLIVLVSLFGETVAPKMEKYAHDLRLSKLEKRVAVSGTGELWARDGDTFVSIRQIQEDGVGLGIRLFTVDDERRMQSMTYAERGEFEDNRWALSNVRISRFEEGEVQTRQQPSLSWQTTLSPSLLDIASFPPEKLGLMALWEYVTYLDENNLEDNRYHLTFWNRLVSPFATAGMILLAVPMIFGSLRTVGVGQRIVVGALIGIVFYLLNAILSRLGAVYDIPTLFSALFPTAMVYLASYWMLKRTH